MTGFLCIPEKAFSEWSREKVIKDMNNKIFTVKERDFIFSIIAEANELLDLYDDCLEDIEENNKCSSDSWNEQRVKDITRQKEALIKILKNAKDIMHEMMESSYGLITNQKAPKF